MRVILVIAAVFAVVILIALIIRLGISIRAALKRRARRAEILRETISSLDDKSFDDGGSFTDDGLIATAVRERTGPLLGRRVSNRTMLSTLIDIERLAGQHVAHIDNRTDGLGRALRSIAVNGRERAMRVK